jgi:pilus assembly protein CpaF
MNGPAADPDLRRRLAAKVRERLAAAPVGRVITEPDLAAAVRAVAAEAGLVLGLDDLHGVTEGVRAEVWGPGPLQRLLDDPDVTDVLVNGPDRVWVDRGDGLVPAGVGFPDEGSVRALAVRLAAAAGRRIDEAIPWVDARLPGGVRLHAVIPPVSPEGTQICLRVLRGGGLGLPEIISAGGVPAGMEPVLRALVASRAAFLVSGGTGAGKTTLLAALLSLVDAGERIVLVEDVCELSPTHPHLVRLEARHCNVEGAGWVGLDDLVRQALRMRPDRLVVGECRGAEVRDLLAALNTGHAGGCGTIHANAAADVPARLEALASPAGLGREAVRVQAAAALDAVVHLERVGPIRRVAEIAVVIRDRDAMALEPAWTIDPRDPGVARPGPGRPHLARRLGLT